jgi:hypothetical protein
MVNVLGAVGGSRNEPGFMDLGGMRTCRLINSHEDYGKSYAYACALLWLKPQTYLTMKTQI